MKSRKICSKYKTFGIESYYTSLDLYFDYDFLKNYDLQAKNLYLIAY